MSDPEFERSLERKIKTYGASIVARAPAPPDLLRPLGAQMRLRPAIRTRPGTGGPVAIAAILALAIAAVLLGSSFFGASPVQIGTQTASSGSTTSPNASSTGTSSLAETSSPAASISQPSFRPCQATSLVIRGVRQGEAGIVNLGIDITNAGTLPCTLPQLPTAVQLLRADGTVLDVASVLPTATVGPPVLVQPKVDSAAILTVYWMSWCQPAPGPLTVEVVLPAGAGVVLGPLAGSLLPRCDTPGGASTLQVDGIVASS
jgi:hypothetical protein